MLKIGIVITAKNEERLLKSNLAYHFALGISKAFVYFDAETDNGRKSIEHLENVVIQDSVSPSFYQQEKFLDKFTSKAKEHHTARQCLNTYDAMINCRNENIDWLISIDADELFFPGHEVDLHTFFSAAKNIDVIRLKPLEVINRKMQYKNVFAEETLFKTQKNFASRFDQIYFKIDNPYDSKWIKTSYWFGHTMGKSIINVKSNVVPHNVHRFKLSKGKTKTLDSGFVLHYHVFDFQDFVKKFTNFKNHPPVFLSGNSIGYLKTFFIKLVNDKCLDEEDLKKYYKKNLLFDDCKIKRLYKTRFGNILKRKQNAVVEIRLPNSILKDN